jgi:hypothetical protein
MSDTPRTEAELNRQKCWSDDLVTIDANFACQLERELNAANAKIKRLDGHIERLESIGDSLFDGVTRIEAEQRWRKAKEAKP